MHEIKNLDVGGELVCNEEFTSILQASQSGDQIATLEMLRDKIAKAIDECKNAHDISALANQLQRTLERIENLQNGRPIAASPLSEIQLQKQKRDAERKRNMTPLFG